MKNILLSSAAALALLTSLAFVAGAKADTVSIDTFVAGNSEPWVQATGNQPFGFYSAAYPGDHYEMFGSVAPDVIVLQAGITSLSMTYTGGAVIGGGVTVESSVPIRLTQTPTTYRRRCEPDRDLLSGCNRPIADVRIG